MLASGRPFITFSQVSPPSIVLYNDVSFPPSSKRQGLRLKVHIPAYIILGLLISIVMSAQPVSSSIYKIFFQLLPPLVVLNTPRSLFGPHSFPKAHTQAMSGLFGSTTIRLILSVFSKPRWSQFSPPLTDRYTPHP